MSYKIDVDNGSILKHILKWMSFAMIWAVSSVYVWKIFVQVGEDEVNLSIGGVALLIVWCGFFILMVFYPFRLMDMSDKVEAVNAYNKKQKKNKNKIKVIHPNRSSILILWTAGILTAWIGIGFFLCISSLVRLSGLTRVELLDEVAVKVGLGKSKSLSGTENSASELQSLKNLFDEGVITAVEFEERKRHLGF